MVQDAAAAKPLLRLHDLQLHARPDLRICSAALLDSASAEMDATQAPYGEAGAMRLATHSIPNISIFKSYFDKESGLLTLNPSIR